MFLIDDAVEVLVGERNELFKYERAIRLFQFQVWTLTSQEFFPGATTHVSHAGQIAAVMFLDYLEEEDFVESESEARKFRAVGQSQLINLGDKPLQRMERILMMRQNSNIYRQIYDQMLALPGGLLGLLGTPSPGDFDLEMARQKANADAVVGMVENQLRYIQDGSGDKRRGSSPAQAIHFMWAATKDIRGRRGKTVEGKSPSARTLGSKWRQYERSAIFIYLNERHGFSQRPMPIDDFEFVPNLLKQSDNLKELRRYFGAYAYITECFKAAGQEQPSVKVPATIDRVPISTEPFSEAELGIIAGYEEDKPLIDSRLEADDLDI